MRELKPFPFRNFFGGTLTRSRVEDRVLQLVPEELDLDFVYHEVSEYQVSLVEDRSVVFVTYGLIHERVRSYKI